MPRGERSSVGAKRMAPNRYEYTKLDNGKWELTHRLIAEQKLGRKLRPNERVKFKDNNRSNLDPDNIVVTETGASSTERRRAQLQVRIEELQAELDSLR